MIITRAPVAALQRLRAKERERRKIGRFAITLFRKTRVSPFTYRLAKFDKRSGIAFNNSRVAISASGACLKAEADRDARREAVPP